MSAAGDLETVLARIRDPENWADADTLFRVIRDNPSLRGFIYGYVSEMKFEEFYLRSADWIDHFIKDDDHKKSKSDRTIVYRGTAISVQVKSVQTNSIKVSNSGFIAKVQNDASDRRKVKLPNGRTIETTCYLVGEYDLLAVSLQPFTGIWKFAFKLNQDLNRTTSSKYRPSDRQHLLATLETLTYPLDASWTTDFRRALDLALVARG
jgi:hypothetical protein